MPDRTLRTVHVDAERGFSGGEVQVFLLLEGLRARGHQVLLVAPPASRAGEEARRRGIECAAVPMRSDADLCAVWRLSRLFRQSGADLVHLHTGRATWLGGLAAAWAGIPAITTRRMDRPVRRNARNRLVYRRLVRRVAAISGPVAELLREGGVPPERIELIHSAVDVPRPPTPDGRRRLRAELGAGADDVVLLVLATLVARKGIDVLLRALGGLTDLPHVVLWIAGEGPEREALERLAAELGVAPRARFLGRREDAQALLAACDVYCLPSRREGLGVSALEALASARPVVASRVGGLAEAVEDGRTGLLVAPDDAAALCDALRRLAADPDLRLRLGAAGPRSLERGYLTAQMVGRYEDLYRRVLAEGQVA
ncbi:MAG: glycosyltransferase family 4 protein [Planctomycetes bacterium]|nr:glycosyltransferase family 4 protein [Planctomycetota bacterium]